MRVEREQLVTRLHACPCRWRAGVDMGDNRIGIEEGGAALVEHRLIRNAHAKPSRRFLDYNRSALLRYGPGWSDKQCNHPQGEYGGSGLEHSPFTRHHPRTPSGQPSKQADAWRHALPSPPGSTG